MLLPALRRPLVSLHLGCLLDTKSAAVDAIKLLQTTAEKEYGRKLWVMRMDNGGEFTTAEFAVYRTDKGIQHHYSVPYSPQQNSVVEHHNQMVVVMAHALLKQRGMPTIFWGEVVMMAIHVLNRSPTKALNGNMPYKVWYGPKLTISYF